RPEAEPSPRQLARQARSIEPLALVTLDACGQDVRLPRACRQLEALNLFDHGQNAASALAPATRLDVLPAQEKAHQVLRRDGLDLAAQPLDRVRVDPGEQTARAG